MILLRANSKLFKLLAIVRLSVLPLSGVALLTLLLCGGPFLPAFNFSTLNDFYSCASFVNLRSTSSR